MNIFYKHKYILMYLKNKYSVFSSYVIIALEKRRVQTTFLLISVQQCFHGEIRKTNHGTQKYLIKIDVFA